MSHAIDSVARMRSIYPTRVPPWVVELLAEWSTIDMPKFGRSQASEEMLALIREMERLEETQVHHWAAIVGHFKPWVGGGIPLAPDLFDALEAIAQRIDEELGE